MAVFSSRAFGQEILTLFVVNMVKGFVGSFPVRWYHPFVNIPGDFFLTHEEIGVLPWSCRPRKFLPFAPRTGIEN